MYSLHASITGQISPILATLHNCCIVVYVQSLLGLLWSNGICSNCMWTSLLLSPIAGSTKVFNTTLQWDWLCYRCHLLHNVVKARLGALKNNAANPTQTTAALVQEALDRSVLLSFHCIATQNGLAVVSNEHVCNVLHS